MKKRLHVLCILAALSAACLVVLPNLRTAGLLPCEDAFGKWEASLSTQNRHVPEATLTDAAQLYRICSSRPQRIVPTHGSGGERIPGSSGSLARRYNVQHLQSYHDGRCRQETAPFCMSASRLYYVIALRHILC